MSENLQLENEMKNLQEELECIDKKYPYDTEDCANCMEKLTVYTRFIADLSNKELCLHFQQNLDIQTTNARVQHDLNTVRDCLDGRKEIEKQAIESLSDGMIIIRTYS